MIRRTAVLSALVLAAAAFAADAGIVVEDAYARAASPTAKTGAAFMTITNDGAGEDRLIAVASDAADRVEIHTHVEDANGVMRMIRVEDGIALAPGATHMLRRGGDHVMLMGLRLPFEDGTEIGVTLTFETAGEITVSVPVDNARKPGAHSH